MPQRPVREIIEKQKLVTAAASDSVFAAARVMLESHVGAVVVVDGTRLVGIFTERDALFRVIAAGLDPKTTKLAQVMTAEPRSITPSATFGNALHTMYEGGFRHVPVVEGGRPVGMISARDALGPELAAFAAELETRQHIGEILG